MPNLVNKVRNEEIKEGRGRKWRGDAGLHRNRSSTAAAGGRTASSGTSGLVVLWWFYSGQKKEEGEGYKRQVVVLPLPLVVVRIEEGRIDEATGELPRRWGRC